MKAYLDHAGGMKRLLLGELSPGEILSVSEGLSRAESIGLVDHQDEHRLYKCEGTYRIEPEGTDAAVVFTVYDEDEL